MSSLEIAGLKDSEELKAFYYQFPIRGMVELRPSRPEDFFAPYLSTSSDFETYVIRGKSREIQGLATFLFRESLLNGQVVKTAFATDLRISPLRGPLLEWSQNFLPVIRSVYERHKVAAVFSAMNRNDTLLNNIFLRPRSPRRAWPRYHLYRRFEMVSLHGRYPWIRHPLKTIRIERAIGDHKDRLIAYLSDRARFHPFSSCWDKDSFELRLRRLKGIRVEDFWLAIDTKDRIVGCVGTWSNRHLQEYRPLSYSLVAHNFRQFLKFGRILGWTRSLTKPVKSTGVESPLKFRFLVFPYATNEDVFDALLHTAFDNIPTDEFLIYSHCEQDFRRRPPRGWIAARMPYSLYDLLPTELPVPAFLDPSEILNPELETYLYL